MEQNEGVLREIADLLKRRIELIEEDVERRAKREEESGEEFEAMTERWQGAKEPGGILAKSEAMLASIRERSERLEQRSAEYHEETRQYHADLLTEIRRHNDVLEKLLEALARQR